MKYVLKLECPHCHNKAEQVIDKNAEAPRLHCGECLWEKTAIVELKIASVEVLIEEITLITGERV